MLKDGISATSVSGYYTSGQVDELLTGYSPTGHQHVEGDITDLDKYTQSEVDNLISGAVSGIDLSDYYTSGQVDTILLDYYTETEFGEIITGYSITGHQHTETDITDLDKYTTGEIQTLLSGFYKLDGSFYLSGIMNAGGYNISGLANPSESSHGVNLQYLTGNYTELSDYNTLSGTVSGYYDEYITHSGTADAHHTAYTDADVQSYIDPGITTSGITLSSTTPVLYYEEYDLGDPSGRFRWYGNAGTLSLQRSKLSGWGDTHTAFLYDATGSLTFNTEASRTIYFNISGVSKMYYNTNGLYISGAWLSMYGTSSIMYTQWGTSNTYTWVYRAPSSNHMMYNAQYGHHIFSASGTQILEISTDGVDLHGYYISGLADPIGSSYAVNLNYLTGNYYTQTEFGQIITGYSVTGHSHVESDITDLDKYTQSEVDSLISGISGADLSDYYTSGQVDTILLGYSITGHSHIESDITDLDKYGTGEIQSLLSGHSSLHEDLFYTETETESILSGFYTSLSTYNTHSGTVDAHHTKSTLADVTPLTTRGDIMVRDASASVRLPIGTSGQVLTSDGTDALWETPSAETLEWYVPMYGASRLVNAVWYSDDRYINMDMNSQTSDVYIYPNVPIDSTKQFRIDVRWQSSTTQPVAIVAKLEYMYSYTAGYTNVSDSDTMSGIAPYQFFSFYLAMPTAISGRRSYRIHIDAPNQGAGTFNMYIFGVYVVDV